MHTLYVKLLKTMKHYVEEKSFNGLELVIDHGDD